MIDREDIEERVAFIGYGDSDRQLLADMGPMLEANADRLVAAFYRHLLSFEETRKLLADPDRKRRLIEHQRKYLLSLAGPVVDEVYARQRLHIGEVHERVGLRTRWYLGAFAVYFSLISPLIHEELHHDPDRCERTVTALAKLLIFDGQMAVQAYILRRQEELDHLNRELAAAGRELAEEVREQTVELKQTQARARAAEELASVGTLVAGLAHEVGTPMGVIRGHAEALESIVQEERTQWRIRTIREQVDRISKIIESLLNIARPRPAVREPVRLHEVIAETLVFVSERLRQLGIEVKPALSPVPALRGDPEKLQQLFLNLLLNAADAMPQGGRLDVRLDAPAPERVEVSIADTGAGIPPETLPRIFDPFFTTKPAGQGNGLGLVVANGIVRDHGGKIEVESELGTGTTFRIALPLQPLSAQDESES